MTISSCSIRGLFHGAAIRAFHQPLALWMHQHTVTRPITAFLYLVVNHILNKKALHPFTKDEELLLSCYHLHSLLSHDNNLSEYITYSYLITEASGKFISSNPKRAFIPIMSIKTRLGNFFLQLQGLFHGAGTRAFHQLLALWVRWDTATRPVKAFCTMLLYFCFVPSYNMFFFNCQGFCRLLLQREKREGITHTILRHCIVEIHSNFFPFCMGFMEYQSHKLIAYHVPLIKERSKNSSIEIRSLIPLTG